MERYIEALVKKDIQEKMVLIGGPRQVGKTTMAFSFLGNANESHPAYLNWDSIRLSNQSSKENFLLIKN